MFYFKILVLKQVLVLLSVSFTTCSGFTFQVMTSPRTTGYLLNLPATSVSSFQYIPTSPAKQELATSVKNWDWSQFTYLT